MKDFQNEIINFDCLDWLNENNPEGIHLTFFDPPFRQGKEYRYFNDNLPENDYWNWLQAILTSIYRATEPGGAIYFMQREKNAEKVLEILREAKWHFQNLIIWRKKTSAVPSKIRFGKQYQIIVFATKGKRPRVFNRLRIDPPLEPGYRNEREDGIYITDVWDDIRELTSGYYAGDEAIRDENGKREHTQQSPVALLLRIILSSSRVGDLILDPFAGSGTTLIVSQQLNRNYLGIEIDPHFAEMIKNRLNEKRKSDDINKFFHYYRFTPQLEEILGKAKTILSKSEKKERK